MTVAERFLQEKLNPPKPAQPIIEARVELEKESLPVPAFLRNPVFSNYKIFWSIGALLVVILIDVIIMMSTDGFEAINHPGSRYYSNCMAYIVSLLTPISFWIPILLIARWAWKQAIFKVLIWFSSVWMIVLHLIKIGVVFSSHGIEGGEMLLGIIMFLLGGLGIAAVVWCLVRLVRQKTNLPSLPDGDAGTESTEKKICLSKKSVSIKCPECNKSYVSTVQVADDKVCCPHCSSEHLLLEVENNIKEPIPCQIARAILYIIGVLLVVGSIFDYGRGFSILGLIIWIWLTFGCASALKKGKSWPRYLYLVVALITTGVLVSAKFHAIMLYSCVPFVLPTVLLFLPGTYSWFSVKRMIRKSYKK